MTHVVHDGRQQQLPANVFANLGELIEEWGRALGAEGRVITRLRLDDRELGGEELDYPERIGLSDVGRIDIESRPSRDVAIDSLESCAQYCVPIGRALVEAFDCFRTGRIEDGSQRLVNLADSLEVLTAAVSAAARVLRPDAEDLAGLSADLIPWLEALTEAQVEGDWVRVADYLEFELSPRVEHWGECIRRRRAELLAPSRVARPGGDA